MPYNIEGMYQQVNHFKDAIAPHIYTPIAELEATVWVTPEPVSFKNKCTGEMKVIKKGETWGKLWDCGWFHLTGEAPAEAKGKKLVLLIDVNGEGCLFDEQGCPIRGLTNISSSFDFSLGRPGKRVLQFVNESEGNEKVDIWLETGCNDLFGRYSKKGTLENADIAICHEEMRSLYYDVEVLASLMESLPKDSARYSRILYALYEAKLSMKDYTEEEAIKARKIMKPELDKQSGDPSLTVSGIGHAHIDLAWLWPIRETIRKGGRTFSTVIELMERYPDYIFGASQPQLYQWMKDGYPLLYNKMKERIKEGRWEVQGGMWVEPDTNVSGGEALVRQFLYGKKFFREEFDQDMKVLWLPDVFGYTGALPQIMKKSGIDYFMTIKLSWNSTNQFPHHTFVWEGIDGSKVLAHMPPEGTYNSSAKPDAIDKAEKSFKDKGVSDYCLMLYGIGDGGGGPGAEHLERLKRIKNLAGIAPVKQEFSIDFFERIEKNQGSYQTWCGELYLEKHRGTLTTHGRNKWYNRKMEYALRELEYVASLASQYEGFSYPQEKLEKLWKEVLLYQFHDILPGSSIKRVYDESVDRYELMLKETEAMIKEVYEALVHHVDASNYQSPYFISNSLSWERKEWIDVEGKWFNVIIPPMGYTVIEQNINQTGVSDDLHVDECFMANDKLKIAFNENGTIQSIFDKVNNKEVLAPMATANELTVYVDEGNAWDIPFDYYNKTSERFELVERKAYIDGPKVIVRQTYTYDESKLIQDVVLTKGSYRIDFHTQVNWYEESKMLRTSFPVDIYAKEATCDIQFGTIKRPTHNNTTWDMAKYEVAAHKFVDLSQRDYGVALMNDSKYGYRVHENTMDLNLLRSTQYPGESADQGKHEFTYSLYPHLGDHVKGEVSKVAYELNIPLRKMKVESSQSILQKTKSFIQIDAENIVIEAVKKAEYDDSMIVRLYENNGQSTNANIQFDWLVKRIELVNFMEEYDKNLTIDDNNKVALQFKPFEIHTLKIKA
ncbi:alpha-mannosidase [Vallitalea okinawensis]|uniref:alpha-mannosidase n=1 Tax=Vallitalea okinawensis TaxID=2078660 RepID=UPI000CFCDFDA|nr:glycoside hydrolase family 38 C-terminal domain-containing protein [Vallitalea okinawensis]